MDAMQKKLDGYYHDCCKKDATIERLTNTLDSKTNQLVTSMKEIADLRVNVTVLTNKVDSTTWTQFRQPRQTVLVGSSVVRDISQSCLDNTQVISIPGGTISQLKEKISSLSNDTHREKVILAVGGNDCDPRDSTAKTASDIVDDYRALVSLSKTKAHDVVVSSVCPRLKSDEVKTRIDDVNVGLQVMCGEEDITFVDNSKFLHLADGSINDGYYLKDGVHLNSKATDKLVHNLQLKLKDNVHSACVTNLGVIWLDPHNFLL